jgi:hypothetical protein
MVDYCAVNTHIVVGTKQTAESLEVFYHELAHGWLRKERFRSDFWFRLLRFLNWFRFRVCQCWLNCFNYFENDWDEHAYVFQLFSFVSK